MEQKTLTVVVQAMSFYRVKKINLKCIVSAREPHGIGCEIDLKRLKIIISDGLVTTNGKPKKPTKISVQRRMGGGGKGGNCPPFSAPCDIVLCSCATNSVKKLL